LIIARKAEDSGIDKRWVRNLNEVLGCPDWVFEEQFVHDNVLYTHGTGCSGKGIMKRVQSRYGERLWCKDTSIHKSYVVDYYGFTITRVWSQFGVAMPLRNSLCKLGLWVR
jgi:hypothetical protein